MDYEVTIAGGSFTGLAAATQLQGRSVPLIEPYAIGTVQTSADHPIRFAFVDHEMIEMHPRENERGCR